MVIHGFVFDIDDTLYPEGDYVRSGFMHVARAVGRSADEVRALSDWLLDAFDRGVRGDTFDLLREVFPEVAARVSTEDLVEAYRTHRPSISLSPGVAGVLDALRRHRVRLGVLSDGPVASQSAKAQVLGLDRWFDPVLLTGSRGTGFAKPGIRGFQAIADAWKLAPKDLAYVGDNPEKDFAGPRALGWLTVRVRNANQIRYTLEPPGDSFRPEIEIADMAEVMPWLAFDR
jgi:putative hydrolase of the HAD superfamily